MFFEKAEYRFFEDVPKEFEKGNAFRRWILEELLGGKRPRGKNGSPTKFVPLEKLTHIRTKTASKKKAKRPSPRANGRSVTRAA